MPDRDEAQHKADLDWLYGRQPTPEEQTRRLDDRERAELERRAAARAAQARQNGGGAGASAASAASARKNLDADAPADGTRADLPPVATPVSPVSRSSSVTPAREAVTGAAAGASAAIGSAASRLRSRVRTPGSTTLQRPGRRRWSVKRIIALVVALLIAWLVWLVAVPTYAWSSMKQITAVPGGTRPAEQPGTAILLIGSDARSDLTAAEQAKLGTGTETGSRTDTMMILYIPPSGKTALISLPRDSYVPIPGYGKNKINAAYSLGGPQLMMETVEQDTGVRLDGYLEIGMDGFSNVIDSLGGIRMCLKTAMVDADSHTNLKAGCQTLTGPQALGYVRMRKADPLGDLGRVQRQRAMLAAVAKKTTSFSTLVNPVRYWKVNMAVRSALTRQGLGITTLPTVGKGLMNVANGNGLQLTVPVSSTDTTTSAGSSVIWDHTKALEMFHYIEKGDTASLTKFAS